MANNNKLDVTIDVKLNGKDALGQLGEIKSNVSNLGNNVSKDFSKINSSANRTGTGLKTAFGNALGGVSEKVRGISQAFSGLNGVMSGIMGTIGLGSFKSLTLDMAMTRDQAKNLLAVTMQGNSTFAEASATAGAFIDKIKEGTSGSVVKLQMMIEAMNGIKLSTGMANKDLESLNDVIRKVGEASLLMGDDTEHATFVMKEAMSGLNGDFAVLKEQFGITADKMKAAGWSGAADDVQGYRKALEQCLSGLGDMGQVMDTTSGKVNKIKSSFSSAGLEIGNQMLPAVDWVASAFLDANANGNLLAKGILYAGGAASTFASLAPSLKPMFDTYDSIKGAVDKAKGATELLTGATKTMNSITAILTGTKVAETAATEAEALAETTNTAAKGVNTVGTEVNAGAQVSLATAMGGAAGAAWALTVALLKNPWTWVVVAVVALVAILWHLYNTNENVRNAINQLAADLKGKLVNAWNTLKQVAQQVWSGLQQLGQIIYSMLVPAWNELQVQLQPLWTALVGLYDTFRALFATLTGGSNTVTETGNNINYLAEIGKIVGAVIVGIVQGVILFVQTLSAVLIPVITFVVDTFSILVGVINGVLHVYNNLSDGTISLGEAFGALGDIAWEALDELGVVAWEAIQSIVSNLGGVWNSLSEGVRTEIANMAAAFLDSQPILAAIISLATSIVNFFLDLLGIASPGTMAQKMGEEMGHIAEFIMNGIGTIIGAIINLATSIVTNFINALINLPAQVGMYFNQLGLMILARLGYISVMAGLLVNAIRNAIVTRFNLLLAGVRNVFTWVVMTIRQRLTQAWTVGGMLANMVRQAIVNKFNQIIARARSIFTTIVSTIRSRLQNAVSAARSKAQEIYQGIKDKITNIPQMVADEFGKIKDRISSALSNAASAAASGAAGIVNAFKSALGIASPGYVQRMTAAEFATLPEHIASSGALAVNETTKMARGIVDAWTGNMESLNVGFNAEDSMISQFNAFNPSAMINPELISSKMIGMEAPNRTQNTNTYNQDQQEITNIHIENISLDCHDLTKQESRELLYNALDGLYTGGA